MGPVSASEIADNKLLSVPVPPVNPFLCAGNIAAKGDGFNYGRKHFEYYLATGPQQSRDAVSFLVTVRRYQLLKSTLVTDFSHSVCRDENSPGHYRERALSCLE